MKTNKPKTIDYNISQALKDKTPKIIAPIYPVKVAYPCMPVGSVIAFAGEIRGNTTDSGPHKTNLPMFNWLLCDGSEVKIAQYPELFSALGYRYRSNNHDGYFYLPNYMGKFLRGVGTDKASTEQRESPGDGDVNSVGSSQKHALQTHTHKYDKPTQGLTVSCESPTGIVAADISADTGAPSIPSQQLSTNETRPVNTFVYWLIKTRLDS